MIIGLDFIGSSAFGNVLPFSSSFYSVEMTNCICDEIYISKNGDINDKNKKSWIIDTILNAKFQGDLEGGNVTNGGLEIDQWRVRRRKIDEMTYKEITTVKESETENFQYVDYTPGSSIIYEYEIAPMSGDIEGTPTSITIEVEFDYWWITDDEETYPLYLNLQISDITTNQQRYVYEGFDEFPAISYGSMQYDSGSITAMILDEHLRESKNYREKFKSFIINKKAKTLKNPSGDTWLIDTYMPKRKILQANTNPSYFSFDWTQIG